MQNWGLEKRTQESESERHLWMLIEEQTRPLPIGRTFSNNDLPCAGKIPNIRVNEKSRKSKYNYLISYINTYTKRLRFVSKYPPLFEFLDYLIIINNSKNKLIFIEL